VKATPNEQTLLLKLQEADTRLSQLEHTEKKLPQAAAVAALTPKVEAVRQQLVLRTGELEDARIELKRVESDVAVVEARIARDAGRLEHSASMKDAQALESELASLKKRRYDLEEIELTVMERIEQIETALGRVEAERESLGAQLSALEAELAEERSKIAAAKKALADDREVAAGHVPADLVALYEKQRARYGVGAALLLRGVSLGSNVKLNESDLAVIRRAAPDEVLLCPDSGAILIRNAESGL
jgi:predicted  nucleic acid-binding Zn-ribbon protein